MTPTRPERSPELTLEPGSFRDRDGRVFYDGAAVYRGLSRRAAEEWRHLARTRFFRDAIAAGRIVGTEEADPRELPPSGPASGFAALLRHERVPLVSYPFEWPFGMLRDAALLQLDLLVAALEEDLVLKDGTPYNVQWRGSQPCFIDVPSFVRLAPGSPWPGYRQFCELQLFPLMLQAYRGVPFHPWLRGRVDGITPVEMRSLLSARDRLRPGVLLHVVAQSALERRHAGDGGDARADLRAAGFKKELLQASVTRLRRLVRGLEWRGARSTWSEYASDNTYGEADRRRKADFVRRALARRQRRSVWDLGANTGEYALVAAEQAAHVVAIDADHLAVERLYRQLRQAGSTSVLPLVMNLADPSPDLGWRGAERRSLEHRGAPEVVLALALLHHLVIGANVPMTELLDHLRSLGDELVVEFARKEDPMVRALLARKDDLYADYELGSFERALGQRFAILAREERSDGLRVLYHAARR